MQISRRTLLMTAALAPFAACGVHRKVMVLAENVPGTRAIRDIAVQRLGATADQFILDRYEEMTMKANTDFSSRTGSYDLVLQYNASLASYVGNDYIIPLTELSGHAWISDLQNTLFQKAWRETGWYGSEQNPRPFGVPFAANSMLLCCNRALFENAANRLRYSRTFGEELAPPTTWDQFERIAQFFTTDSTRGVVLHGADLWNYYEWANLVFGSGGGVMQKRYGWVSDRNTRLILSSPETIAATERYVRLKAYSQYGQRGTDFFSTDAIHQVQLMRTGQYAMALLWSDVAYDLVQAEQSLSTAYLFSPIPGPVSMLAGGCYYINRRSPSIDSAVELVGQLFQPETQKELARRGLCSPRRDIYADEALLRQVPYLASLATSLERGVYMLEAGRDADEIMARISTALQQLFRGESAGDVASRMRSLGQEVAAARERFVQPRDAT